MATRCQEKKYENPTSQGFDNEDADSRALSRVLGQPDVIKGIRFQEQLPRGRTGGLAEPREVEASVLVNYVLGLRPLVSIDRLEDTHEQRRTRIRLIWDRRRFSRDSQGARHFPISTKVHYAASSRAEAAGMPARATDPPLIQTMTKIANGSRPITARLLLLIHQFRGNEKY